MAEAEEVAGGAGGDGMVPGEVEFTISGRPFHPATEAMRTMLSLIGVELLADESAAEIIDSFAEAEHEASALTAATIRGKIKAARASRDGAGTMERVKAAVEVAAMRSGPPCMVGKFYVVTKAAGSRTAGSWPQIVAGPFDTASEAVERRTPGTRVVRECAR